MVKKIQAPQSASPAADRAVYFEQFAKCAWLGSYCTSWVGGAILAAALAVSRFALRTLVTAGGFVFGVLLTLAAFCGLCWLISLITGKGE